MKLKMIVSDLFHARGVFMTEITNYTSKGIFPSFLQSELNKSMSKFLTEISKDYPYSNTSLTTEIPNQNKRYYDYQSLSKIRELEPEKHKIYLEKILTAYQKDIDNAVHMKTLYNDFGHRNPSITFCARLIPKNQSMEIEIKMHSVNINGKDSVTSIYTKEFSSDTSISAIKENIAYFFKKRQCDLALKNLSNDYK